MHSYVEQVTYLPTYAMEEQRAGERRPMRVAVAAASFAMMACVAVLLVASDGGIYGGGGGVTELAPKFVDWKKEDAGSDDMNLHLKVADALAKVGSQENLPFFLFLFSLEPVSLFAVALACFLVLNLNSLFNISTFLP